MVLDSSAVLAILLQEPEAASFTIAMETAERRTISAFSVFEAGVVMMSRRRRPGLDEFDNLLLVGEVEIVSFDASQAQIAREAYARFGKGRHPAALNLGDCAAYALAKSLGEPLLFKGDDFARTDVVSALS